jgi:cytoskeletal protein CcmA (bactofilin family)
MAASVAVPNPMTAAGAAAIPRAPALPPRSGGQAGAGPRREERSSVDEGKKLTVGRDISLSGEITSCDKLVVEGTVEAAMSSRVIEISESGVFRGNATVETADIAGRFEGTLTVTDRISLRSTGRVRGTLRYAQIEVEAGGQVAGDIDLYRPPSNGAPAAKSGQKSGQSARTPEPEPAFGYGGNDPVGHGELKPE